VKLIASIGALVLLTTASAAQCPTTSDSSTLGGETARADKPDRVPWVTRRDGLVLGGALVATIGLTPLDRPIAREFEEPHWRKSRLAHHAAGDVAFLGGKGPFEASAVIAGVTAVAGPAGLERFAVHNMEAIALATVVTGIGKGLTGRALPGVATKHAFQFWRGFHDGNGPFVSFPSGHTAAAFAMASTISGELRHADSPRAALFGDIAFGAATAVGVARVVQSVHWVSDLPLAAAIGIWSGRVVQAHASTGGETNRADLILHGLSVGRDGNRIRLGWSRRASDAFATLSP
jgi:membrane-associated phospholipid phosphatase